MTDAEKAPGTRQRRTYSRRTLNVHLPRDQVGRQGQITHLAFQLLGRDEAITFLNAHHPSLGARPLDLATADSAGFVAVESVVRDLAIAAAGPKQ